MRTPDWTRPFETLRGKWVEVPLDDYGRRKTSDLVLLSDDELLDTWLKVRQASTTGSGFSIRGWFHALYVEAMRGKKVLDVGCGLAYDSITFAQHGAAVTFVDLTESNIQVVTRLCKIQNLTNVDFLMLQDLDSLKTLGADFDVILALGSLHCAPFEIIRAEVQELLRHLKLGGRWLQLAYPKTRWAREGRLPFDRWGERTDGAGTPWMEWYDLEKVLRLMAPARFDVVLDLEFHNSDFNWFDLLLRSRDGGPS